jgi:transcriptional regulator of heat shock response
MKAYARKKILDKMFEAALKEKFSELKRRYEPDLVFEIWAQLLQMGGIKALLDKKEWDEKMTIKEALDCLDGYAVLIESFILEEKKGGVKMHRQTNEVTIPLIA